MVCEGKKSSKLTPAMRWLIQSLNQPDSDVHKTRGQVCQHAKSCGAPHAHSFMWVERVHSGTACKATDLELLLAHHLTLLPLHIHPTSQLFLSLFSLSLCFLLLYGAAPSSSNPQEVIHFLIICTSNRGRHRDADHKFSPPPLRCGAIAQQQLPLIGAVGSNC